MAQDEWKNENDYSLLEGISKYGLEEWEKIVEDEQLWKVSDPQIRESVPVWKTLFIKIEGEDTAEEEETKYK